MIGDSFEDAVERIVQRDSRFSAKAYIFLRDALDFTIQRVMDNEKGGERHVSGMELLEGFRDFALEQFGPMASTVIDEWGIKTGRNVGEMVFLLIDEQIFSKQPGDSLDDFNGMKNMRKILLKPFEVQVTLEQ